MQGTKERGRGAEFAVGDQVCVRERVVVAEGSSRVRSFTGVVVSARRAGRGASFSVRARIRGEGVERTFPRHGPTVVEVRIERRGKARRAKLVGFGASGARALKFHPLRTPPKRRKRGARAKREREARRAAGGAGPPPPPAGSAGVLARLRPSDPPFVPPSPREAGL